MANGDLDLSTYSKLTNLIYAAVFDQERWQDVLNEITIATGGVRTHLFGFDIPAGISLGLTAAGYAPEFIDSYNEHYGALNAWAVGFASGAEGAVTPSQVMCPKEILFKTEFYNDWVRPQEDVAAGGGAMIFKDNTRMLAFGGNIRLKDEEHLEAPWLRTVGLLTPHLQQAFEISRTLAGTSLELDLLQKQTISAGSAVLLLAENAFLLYANQVGEQLLNGGGILRDDNAGRVSLTDPTASARLEEYLKHLHSEHLPVSAAFYCNGPTEDMKFICRIIPFSPDDHPVSPFPLVLGYRGTALLMTLSPVVQDTTVHNVFRTEHGLTEAETAVATGIADGFTTAELAELRSVSIHTIRNQLKSALAKTDSHRQIDLVRKIENAKSELTKL